jgi:RecT family
MKKRHTSTTNPSTQSNQFVQPTSLSKDFRLKKAIDTTDLNAHKKRDDVAELPPLVDRAVKRSGLPYPSFVSHLIQGAFRGVAAWTKMDLERLLMAAEKYGLDPLSREVFMLQSSADPTSPLVVLIGVDGWTRIINSHEQFDGITFTESTDLDHGVPAWIECTIFRRDRRVPLAVREYLCEVRGEHLSWITHPRRMLRYRALVQCAKLAFGLSGVCEAEDAHRSRMAKICNEQFVSAEKLAQMLGDNAHKTNLANTNNGLDR